MRFTITSLVAFLLLASAAVLLAAPALAQAPTPTLAVLYAGANGVWFDDAPFRSEIEACANGRASLSPHLSAVGSLNYGFSRAYFRSSVGVRATATDTENPNFSLGLGIQYHMASITGLRPNEWAPEVAVGYRPWPERWPRWSLTGLGWYGLDTNRATADLGVRYRLNL